MSNWLKHFFSLTWLENPLVKRNFKFVMFLILLAFIYLLNSLIMDYNIRRYNELLNEVKVLKIRYIELERCLNNNVLLSEIEKKIKKMHFKIRSPKQPPQIIKVE